MMSVSDRRLFDGPTSSKATLLLAHGAGAGMESSFMEATAQGLAGLGWHVVRFEFPYMQRQRLLGKRRPPDRAEILIEHFREQVSALAGSSPLFIGGKSMGGRIASMSTHLEYVGALICLGYPFHPPGKPEKLRTDHLVDIKVPAMIIQGERDTFGNQDEVKRMNLPSQIKKVWLADGDHSFKPRKKSGRTLEQNMDLAVESLVAFLRSC